MSIELDRRVDELAVAVARGKSRRAILRAALAVGGAAVLSMIPTRAFAASNESCAHFCQQLPPGKLRGKCVEDAAHGKGLCFACGPKGTNAGLCGTHCCPPGTVCRNGQCVLTGGGIGSLKCPCGNGTDDACTCILCGDTPGVGDTGFLCVDFRGTGAVMCCTSSITGQSYCADTLTDVQNCGGCGIQCAPGQVCKFGQCCDKVCIASTGASTCCTATDSCCEVPGGVLLCCPSGMSCTPCSGGGNFCCFPGDVCSTCPDGNLRCCPPGQSCALDVTGATICV
jgi:hypothetical protein